MGMVQDPRTKQWYDDGSDDYDSLFGGSTNPFRDQTGLSPFSLPGDFNKYGQMEPYEQADVNQQLTGTKNIMGMLGTPMFNYLTSVVTGADTFDYGQLDGTGVGGYGGTTGGGGGAYGGGGGVQPVATPWLDSADTDPQLQNIKKAVFAGQSPAQIMIGLAATNETDPAVVDMQKMAATEMWKERSAAQQAQLRPPQQTAMQEWLAKTGLPDPRAQYGVDAPLPADVMSQIDTSGAETYGDQFRTTAGKQYKDALQGLKGNTYLQDWSKGVAPASPEERMMSDAAKTMNIRPGVGSTGFTGMTPGSAGPDGKWQEPVAMDTPTRLGQPTIDYYTAHPDKLDPDTLRPELQAQARALQAQLTGGGGGPLAMVNPSTGAAGTPMWQQQNLGGQDDNNEVANRIRAGFDKALPITIDQGGKRGTRRTDSAGSAAYSRAQTALGQQKYAQRVGTDYGRLMNDEGARQLKAQNRTPARDRIQSQVAMMRMLGIGI